MNCANKAGIGSLKMVQGQHYRGPMVSVEDGSPILADEQRRAREPHSWQASAIEDPVFELRARFQSFPDGDGGGPNAKAIAENPKSVVFAITSSKGGRRTARVLGNVGDGFTIDTTIPAVRDALFGKCDDKFCIDEQPGDFSYDWEIGGKSVASGRMHSSRTDTRSGYISRLTFHTDNLATNIWLDASAPEPFVSVRDKYANGREIVQLTMTDRQGLRCHISLSTGRTGGVGFSGTFVGRMGQKWTCDSGVNVIDFGIHSVSNIADSTANYQWKFAGSVVGHGDYHTGTASNNGSESTVSLNY